MIFGRHTMLVAMLGGAVALPYLSNSETGKRWLEYVAAARGAPAEPGAATVALPGAGDHLAAPANHHSAAETFAQGRPSAKPEETLYRLEGNQPQTLDEVFRFDITTSWIAERWPRVSAGLSELDLHGYRVPLVTGTTDGDLAGSLTYYFNKKQQVDRIIFHGTTGDPRQLVSLVTARYELKQQNTDDPSLLLFQRKWFGKPTSELRIRPARVLRSTAPHERYEVDLAMKRK